MYWIDYCTDYYTGSKLQQKIVINCWSLENWGDGGGWGERRVSALGGKVGGLYRFLEFQIQGWLSLNVHTKIRRTMGLGLNQNPKENKSYATESFWVKGEIKLYYWVRNESKGEIESELSQRRNRVREGVSMTCSKTLSQRSCQHDLCIISWVNEAVRMISANLLSQRIYQYDWCWATESGRLWAWLMLCWGLCKAVHKMTEHWGCAEAVHWGCASMMSMMMSSTLCNVAVLIHISNQLGSLLSYLFFLSYLAWR
jgi:uncharacterized membrane protein YbaN (DUF454 family)